MTHDNRDGFARAIDLLVEAALDEREARILDDSVAATLWMDRPAQERAEAGLIIGGIAERQRALIDGEIEKLRADVERLSAHVSNLQRAVLWLAHGADAGLPESNSHVTSERARELVSHLVEDHAEGWQSDEKRVAWYRVPKNESPCDGRDPECP